MLERSRDSATSLTPPEVGRFEDSLSPDELVLLTDLAFLSLPDAVGAFESALLDIILIYSSGYEIKSKCMTVSLFGILS